MPVDITKIPDYAERIKELEQTIADREAIIAELRALVIKMHQALNPGCQMATILPSVERPSFFVNYDDDK